MAAFENQSTDSSHLSDTASSPNTIASKGTAPSVSVEQAMDSPTFCVYPWMEQVVQASGKISLCCVAKNGGVICKPGGAPFRIPSDRLEEAWNSDALRVVRKQMVAGEKVAHCNTCYFQETIGKRSYRQMHNQEWLTALGSEIRERVQTSLKNEFRVDLSPAYLDLKLGNLCNLKCRSCNPYNSTMIQKETLELLNDDPEFNALWAKQHGSGRPASPENWYESEEFWAQVTQAIPKLHKVYLTGGEPTLIEKNYEFMQRCIDLGHAGRIFLMFNTNATHLKERFLEYLKHFKFVLINVSLDGFAEDNEYIRFPSHWDTIDRNFRRLLKVEGNVRVGVTPVVQIYNILSLTKLLDYVEDCSKLYQRSINLDLLYATFPPYLDVRILPQSIRNEAVSRLESFKSRSSFYGKESFLTNSIDSCLSLLNQEVPEEQRSKAKSDFTDFGKFTSVLDKKRGQSFGKSFPELHSMILREGLQIP